MAGLKFQIVTSDLQRIGRFFNRLPAETRLEAQDRVYKVTEKIRDEARRLVPVDTGSLQKSIRIQNYSRPAGLILKLGVRAGGYIVNPKTGRLVNYAGHVEYGTSRSPAQPYMRPAIAKFTNELAKAVSSSMIEALEKVSI